MLASNRGRAPSHARRLGVLLPVLALAACSSEATSEGANDAAADATTIDSSPMDSGFKDRAPNDAATPDVAVPDAAAPDVAPDVIPDVAPDVTADVAPDAAIDATPDAAPDVTIDATPDAAPDVAPLDVAPPDTVCSTGTNCSGTCYDLQTSVDHCGACDTACPAATVCVAGACTCACSSGNTCCSLTCRDLQSDNANCGACGNTCPTGQSCVAGACTLPCAAPQTVCGAGAARVCVDTQSDASHCGTCDTACPTGSVCAGGACAATSCNALHTTTPALPSGAYLLDTDGAGPLAPFRAYCDMTSEGGGWTLALKVDGTLPTFLYPALLWTNTATLNPTSTDLSATEAKFDSFSQVPFTAVRLVMRQLAPTASTTDHPIVIVATATSLLSAVTSTGTAVTAGPLATSTVGLATTVDRDSWRSLFDSAGIQCNCGAQGFNVTVIGTHLRLGIFANQENDCNTPDSTAGIGYDTYSAGNNANGTWACGTDYTGDRAVRTFSWVFVR